MNQLQAVALNEVIRRKKGLWREAGRKQLEVGKQTTREDSLANQQIELVRIKTGISIVLPTQFEKREPVLVSSEATMLRLVQVDEAAFDHEHRYHRLRRVLGDHQRVRLSGGFVDVGSGLGNPIMLQVSPMAAHCITMNGADVIVSSDPPTGQPFQNYAKSARCNVEATGLEPNTVSIRDPETVLVQVSVGDEMFAAPSSRIEAVGEAAECIDRHRC